MRIVEYAKSHPVMSGIIGIVGLIIFVIIVRGSGSASSGAVDSGPSDAQISANTALEIARIQSAGTIQAAQVGAGIQLNSDNRAAEIAMRQLDISRELGLAQINAESEAVTNALNSQRAREQAIIGSLGSLKKKNRDDVLKSLITGQYGYQGAPGPSGFSQGVNAVGNAAQGVASLLSVFSDERLKENIRHIGYDAKGRDVYEYNYKGSKRIRRGHIAQSIVSREPDKVITGKGGYMKLLPMPKTDPVRNFF